MNIIIGNKSFLSKSLEIYFFKKKINFEKLNLNNFLKYNLSTYENTHINIFYFSGFNKNLKNRFVESNIKQIQKFLNYLVYKKINCTIYYPSSIYVSSKGFKSSYLKNYINAKNKIEELLVKTSSNKIKVLISRLPSIVRIDFKNLIFSDNSFFNSIINNYINNKVISINTNETRDIVYSHHLFDYFLKLDFQNSKKNFKIEYITNNYPFKFNKFHNKLIKINSSLKNKFVIQSYASDQIKFIITKNKKKCGNFPTYQLMCDSLLDTIKKKHYEL